MKEQQQNFVCECGKSFDTQVKLSHHKTHCKVFQANKKQREIKEREVRRLPNGLFKCDNPDCTNEHDGSYGNGKFCCKACAAHVRSLNSAKSAKKNGHKHKPKNLKAKASPYGTWKCEECNLIFRTRADLYEHNHLVHPEYSKKSAWNKGLTKETSKIIELASKKVNASIKIAVLEGRCTGKAKTPELEQLHRQRMSKAALNRKTPSVSKRTEPYVCKDGTIVNLDSSYERKLAKLFDDNNIKWIRPKPLDWYSKDGIKHHYFPDFYLVDYDVYLDPKNEYCFKVQFEKIQYVMSHYANCYFLHEQELTLEYILMILEQYRSSHNGAAC